MTLLDAKNISISFNERPIVENINFHICGGELIGLVGPNGVGKSTFLKGLARLLTLKTGTIEFLGQPLEQVTRKKLSQTLSYLAQGDIIHWPLEVHKIVSLGRLPYLSPWQHMSEEDSRAVDQAMKAAEVTHLKDRIATKLSGGEKRLVMLARALAVEAKVLLADEPVAGLDPTHQIQVMHLLRTMVHKGHSVVTILHDLSLAARYCDRIYLMSEGRMLVSGKPRDVLVPENLKKVYGITAKYGQGEDGFYIVPWDRL